MSRNHFLRPLRRRAPPGAAPGTLIPSADALPPKVSVVAYDAERIEEQAMEDIDIVRHLHGRYPVTWVDVRGLAEVDLIRGLGDAFGLHLLALEDVINVHQRPKVEEFDDHVFLVTRVPLRGERGATEQITMFLGEDYVLTFQERHVDAFAAVRERVRASRGRLRAAGADYLAYALLDSAIDDYFPVLEHLGEIVEELENAVIADPTRVEVARIYDVRRTLLGLRRAIWPLREMTAALVRDETPFITPATRLYLRDCHDHTVQLMDMVETDREITSGLIELFLSSLSNRMNDIMKVLTMIATIFIPLGFIAGVYGMNFQHESSPWNMPELTWYWGYPAVLGVMVAVAGGMLFYFRRKGWMGRRS